MKYIKFTLLTKISLFTALSVSPLAVFADYSAEDIIANDRVGTMCSLSGSIVSELVTMRADNPDKFYELINNHKSVDIDDINKQNIVDPFMHLGLWVDSFDVNNPSSDISLSYKKMCAEDNLFI
jgi:hypothetical protein